MHRSGQLDAAAAIYRRLYEHDSKNADACYGLGTVLMAQKELSQAAELLDVAVRLEPGVPEFLYNHALVLEQLGQGDRARANLMRAATFCLSDPELLPAICRHDDPLDIAAEGAAPQPGHWPEVTNPTPPEAMVAQSGNGYPMRRSFIARGIARPSPGLPDEAGGEDQDAAE